MIKHVGAFRFGQGVSPFVEGSEAHDNIMNLTAIDSLAAQLVMMEAYDIDYGLFDHNALGPKEDPMAVIGMHDGERIWEGSKMYLFMDELLSVGLPEKLNTPVAELMSWPKHVLDRYIARYKPAAERERKTIADLEAAQAAAVAAAGKS